MAFGNAYTFGFAAAVCIVCSSALATVSMGLQDRQEANARRDLQKNILEALDLPAMVKNVRPSISGDEIDTLWSEKVELIAIRQADGTKVSPEDADVDGNGSFDLADIDLSRQQAIDAQAAAGGDKNLWEWLMVPSAKTEITPEFLGIFVRKDTGTVAVPMTGKGLWGPISAYLAFDAKLTVVKGATFFAPKETPGLGSKIVDPPFEGAWIGKSIVEAGKTVPIRVLKPSECKETTDTHCVDGVSGATITSRGVDAMIKSSLALYEPYFQTVR